ncbi:MAG TPA: hypothetical protein VFF52_23760 [Isosphaeraceae bacterium]|nr:hypothetical protein [Isosphaeraceae bacterium]
MKLPARPIRRARPIPFTWLDGLVLAGFAALAVGRAVSADREFLELLSSFASPRMPWTNLPEWVEDLELPAKRIARDFVTFLSVMSVGIALASFRRRASWCLVGLPRPGIAATATAALVLMAREVWIHGLVWYSLGGFRWVPTLDSLCQVEAEAYSGPMRFVLKPRFPQTFWYTKHLLETPIEVPASLLGVWGYLILARAWKAHDEWRDWLGRWLGWCWIGLMLFYVLAILTWGLVP